MLAVHQSLRQCPPGKLAERVKEFLATGVHPESVRAALAELPPSDEVTKAGELVAGKSE